MFTTASSIEAAQHRKAAQSYKMAFGPQHTPREHVAGETLPVVNADTREEMTLAIIGEQDCIIPTQDDLIEASMMCYDPWIG